MKFRPRLGVFPVPGYVYLYRPSQCPQTPVQEHSSGCPIPLHQHRVVAYPYTQGAMPDSNPEGFARLFSESRAALRRYVLRLVRSREATEEIVQEAFLRTFEQRAD